MIGVLSQGGMGNQMFQFAFAYATAKKLGTRCFIYRPKSLCYFKLYPRFAVINKVNAASYLTRNLLRGRSDGTRDASPKLSQAFLYSLISKNVMSWPNVIEGTDHLLQEPQDNTFYEGFFQSDEYFSDCEDDVKELFEVQPRYSDAFLNSKRDLVAKKYIAVHLRRTDYVRFGGEELGGYDMTLPVAYYKSCLARIPDLEQYKIVFVSDDIDFARREFGEKPAHVFAGNDEITDFQLLLHADGLIISNSTFSWWGAWLNGKANRLVFAPEYFLGFKLKRYYPAGIRVNGWNWVDVAGA